MTTTTTTHIGATKTLLICIVARSCRLIIDISVSRRVLKSTSQRPLSRPPLTSVVRPHGGVDWRTS